MFDYDMSAECVSGHLNILNWAALFTILHMTLPITPVYAAILILRRGIAVKLRNEKAMSENTRQLHAQLLKVRLGHFPLCSQSNVYHLSYSTVFRQLATKHVFQCSSS